MGKEKKLERYENGAEGMGRDGKGREGMGPPVVLTFKGVLGRGWRSTYAAVESRLGMASYAGDAMA